MKTTHKLSFFTILITIATTLPARAKTEYNEGAVLNDRVFYSIGGGTAVMPPPSKKRPNEYGLGIGWQVQMNCGGFDMKHTIKNQLNGITEGFKDLYGNIIESATGAVANLPGLILQRANPQLYDMISNGMYQGKIDFNRAKTSCEAMSNALADEFFSSKLAKAAGIEEYKEEIKNESDALKAEEKKKTSDGKKGVKWVGGKNGGGIGQEPIKIITDTAKAGYNLIQGRPALDQSSISTSQCDGMLCTEWKTPEEMATYARRILGEKTLTTCENCGETKTQAGMGLAPEIEAQTYAKAVALEEILNSDNPTASELQALGTSSVQVTRGLIEALKEDPDVAILAQKLSQELGLSKELEKALVLRRVLLSSLREPNIANSGTLVEEVEKNIKMLDKEIEQAKLELELKQMNSTALMVMNRQAVAQSQSLESNAADSSKRLANLSKGIGANDINTSKGGISGFSASSIEDDYIAVPKAENTGLGNIYGIYKAVNDASNIITNGSYTPLSAINSDANTQSLAIIKNFEGFSNKAYWDVNAYRTGYGSDTYTTTDGRVHKVTKDSVITREDAERDLARRTAIFADNSKKQLNSGNWDKLPANAQAALTSFAYNYGSLKKDIIKAANQAAQTGDMTILANAVRARQMNNKGVNARRRNQEADYILGINK